MVSREHGARCERVRSKTGRRPEGVRSGCERCGLGVWRQRSWKAAVCIATSSKPHRLNLVPAREEVRRITRTICPQALCQTFMSNSSQVRTNPCRTFQPSLRWSVGGNLRPRLHRSVRQILPVGRAGVSWCAKGRCAGRCIVRRRYDEHVVVAELSHGGYECRDVASSFYAHSGPKMTPCK